VILLWSTLYAPRDTPMKPLWRMFFGHEPCSTKSSNSPVKSEATNFRSPLLPITFAYATEAKIAKEKKMNILLETMVGVGTMFTANSKENRYQHQVKTKDRGNIIENEKGPKIQRP